MGGESLYSIFLFKTQYYGEPLSEDLWFICGDIDFKPGINPVPFIIVSHEFLLDWIDASFLVINMNSKKPTVGKCCGYSDAGSQSFAES